MKTSIYCRSKKKWTSEQEALLDVLKQNPPLTEEQLIAGHDEKQFRWSLKQETGSTSSGIVGCLFIIVVIIIGIVFGADYFDNSSANDVQNESSVNDNNQSVTSTSDYNNSNDNNQSESETSSSDNNNSNDNNRLIICPNCNGTKMAETSCDNYYCHSGYVDDGHGNKTIPCPRCNGTRRVSRTCNVCNGEGRVKEYE